METLETIPAPPDVCTPAHPLSPWGDFLAFFAPSAEWIFPIIDICSRYGVFCADETRCMVARPVDSRIPIDVLNKFEDISPAADYLLTMEPDAWHIIYASGDIGNFFALAPYELPKLIWQRDGIGTARIYNYQRIKEKVMASSPKVSKPPKPDPATTASGIDKNAERQSELERKKRQGFYSGFRSQRHNTRTPTGGDSETVG